MLKDRGNKKWVAMMLPEHVAAVKQEMEDGKKIKKPILDEDRIQEIESIILEGMEFASILDYKIFNNGYINNIIGRTVRIVYLEKEIWIEDLNHVTHKIPFSLIVDVVKK